MQQIEYRPRVYMTDIVKFLMTQPDQAATTQQIANAVGGYPPLTVVRDALERLRKVKRVDEFFPNMWHLE